MHDYFDDLTEDEQYKLYEIEDSLPGCRYCGQNHPTKTCPNNPDSHIRKMVRHA